MPSLTVIYTAQIRGELALLPRLHTFLQQIRTRYESPLVLDIGEACAADVWHCAATSGRSTLIVLDAMGYHAANVSGDLPERERAKLQPNLSMGLVDAQHVWRYAVPPHHDEGLIVAAAITPALRLCIVAAPAAATRLEQGTLQLQGVGKGAVGLAQIDLGHTPRLIHRAVLDLSPKLNPDPTIAATVEFVEDEARYFQSRDSTQG